MVNVANINATNFKQNSYGNIQRLGSTNNGRTVYRVIDSSGDEAGKLTIPAHQVDTFETAYRDIMETAPKIQDYALHNSTENDIKKRKSMSRAIVTAGGVIGVVLPITLTKNLSTIKKILSTIGGLIAGLSVGFISSIAATTPPGTFKFAKATRTLSKIDIQPLQ